MTTNDLPGRAHNIFGTPAPRDLERSSYVTTTDHPPERSAAAEQPDQFCTARWGAIVDCPDDQRGKHGCNELLDHRDSHICVCGQHIPQCGDQYRPQQHDPTARIVRCSLAQGHDGDDHEELFTGATWPAAAPPVAASPGASGSTPGLGGGAGHRSPPPPPTTSPAVIVGRALVGYRGVPVLVETEDGWGSAFVRPVPRAEAVERFAAREALLVSPAAWERHQRLAAAAEDLIVLSRSAGVGVGDIDDAQVRLSEALDAMVGDRPAEPPAPPPATVLCGCGVKIIHATEDGYGRDGCDDPIPDAAPVATDLNRPSDPATVAMGLSPEERAAFAVALEEEAHRVAEPVPVPDSGPGWDRATIDSICENDLGEPHPRTAQVRALLADRDQWRQAALDAGGQRIRQEALDSAMAEIGRLVQERDAARREMQGVRDELARRAGELDDLRGTLAMRDGQLQAAAADLREARERIKARDKALAELHPAEVDRLRGELEQARKANVLELAAHAESRSEVERLRYALEEKETARANLQHELDSVTSARAAERLVHRTELDQARRDHPAVDLDWLTRDARRKGWDACRAHLAAAYRHEALLGPDGSEGRQAWGHAAQMAETAEPTTTEPTEGNQP